MTTINCIPAGPRSPRGRGRFSVVIEDASVELVRALALVGWLAAVVFGWFWVVP